MMSAKISIYGLKKWLIVKKELKRVNKIRRERFQKHQRMGNSYMVKRRFLSIENRHKQESLIKFEPGNLLSKKVSLGLLNRVS